MNQDRRVHSACCLPQGGTLRKLVAALLTTSIYRSCLCHPEPSLEGTAPRQRSL